MATSSLKKSFVINTKKEADAFVKLFADSLKNPPKSLDEVEYSTISKEQMAQIINARRDYTGTYPKDFFDLFGSDPTYPDVL
ncbi:MAG: hypothetical protein J6S91_10230 [Treponema sp.]|nr:hypothetical protein [Treponema sp.]